MTIKQGRIEAEIRKVGKQVRYGVSQRERDNRGGGENYRPLIKMKVGTETDIFCRINIGLVL